MKKKIQWKGKPLKNFLYMMPLFSYTLELNCGLNIYTNENIFLPFVSQPDQPNILMKKIFSKNFKVLT